MQLPAYVKMPGMQYTLRELLEKGIEQFTYVAGVNVKEARRRIADLLIDENRYCF